jgi:predicted enzyme related to lactoylglutathione lyase
MEVTKYEPGSFCWWELATNDVQAAKQFYGDLFGWGADEMPMGDGTSYIMLKKGSGTVGAMYENKKVPSSWLPYISVDSADETAAKAKSLGATLKSEPFDVFDVGRMANIIDPEGATFAVWQPRKHIGADIAGEPGTVCWNELMAHNGDAERTFYTSLFEWTAKISPEYTEFHGGEKGRGGFLEMSDPRFEGVPPSWLTYFLVEDVDASVAKAKSLGAELHHGPMDIPNVGRFAVLGDPQHATFALFKPK